MGQTLRRFAATFLLCAGCSPTEDEGGLMGGSSGTPTATSTSDSDAQTPDATDRTSGSSGGSDGEVELGPCARFLDCTVALDATPATNEALFGESGECWATSSATLCQAQCEDQANALSDLNPDEPACFECTTDDDCAQDGRNRCAFDHRCAPPLNACEEYCSTFASCCTPELPCGDAAFGQIYFVADVAECAAGCAAQMGAAGPCEQALLASAECGATLSCGDFDGWVHHWVTCNDIEDDVSGCVEPLSCREAFAQSSACLRNGD